MPKILHLFYAPISVAAVIDGVPFVEISRNRPHNALMLAYNEAAVFVEVLIKKGYNTVLKLMVKIY